MKVIGKIRQTGVQELAVEAENYAQARAELESQVPDGWELIQVMIDR